MNEIIKNAKRHGNQTLVARLSGVQYELVMHALFEAAYSCKDNELKRHLIIMRNEFESLSR